MEKKHHQADHDHRNGVYNSNRSNVIGKARQKPSCHFQIISAAILQVCPCDTECSTEDAIHSPLAWESKRVACGAIVPHHVPAKAPCHGTATLVQESD